jgi:SPP1 family phage portal protein
MATLQEIFSQPTPDAVIAALKQGRVGAQPDIETATRALDPEKHRINDTRFRPDKKVKLDAVEGDVNKVLDLGGEAVTYRIEKVARVKLAIQKIIIRRAVSFCFGNPVVYNATPANGKQTIILNALNRILQDNKSNSLDRMVAREMFSYKEVAEIWYPVEHPNRDYGFPSRMKLRCAVMRPSEGHVLYPYWDEFGDLIAFSRAFTRVDGENRLTNYFETYTAEENYLWKQTGGGWELEPGYPKQVAIGKIPVVYGRQDAFETEDVDSLIDRLELLLSNFADTNDYHAAPKIFVKGELRGFSRKGETGAILEGEEGADAKYLEWSSAPESVRLEIETLLRMVYMISQTPDISYDGVKGLGALSGVALKLLFMDAHLKVQDKREVLDAYLQRRANIIKAYIAKLDASLEKECDELMIEPEITPYMPNDELVQVQVWTVANGGKPLISQRASVKAANLVQNPEADYDQILQEAEASAYVNAFEPTI